MHIQENVRAVRKNEFRQLGCVTNLRLLLSGPLSSVYGSHWSTHRLGRAFLVGPVLGPARRVRTKQDFPRFRDERIWGRVVRERKRVCVWIWIVERGTEETRMETERTSERRSWSRWIRWPREGRRGGSLPTYPKFQPVPPILPRYRFLFHCAGSPLAGPPRRWRGGSAVSCGRPASLLLWRESSFIPRSTHCIRVLAFSCSSCSFVREIDVLLTPFSFTWSFSLSPSFSSSFLQHAATTTI